MHLTTDFTLSNKKLSDYFEGLSEVAPIGEFMYLHSHPAIRPNFLTQIEALVAKVWSEPDRLKVTSDVYLHRLHGLCLTLGTLIDKITPDNVGTFVSTLRELYQFTKQMQGALRE
jgi:hypothetical protein